MNEIRLATNGGFVLGSTRFQARVAHMLDRRVTRGKAGRPARGPEESTAQAELELWAPVNRTFKAISVSGP